MHTLLRSLIKQICAGEDMIPQVVQTLVSRHRASGQQPSISTLITVLHNLVDDLRKQTFIILDALDEYPETKRWELLNTLKRLLDSEPRDLHVLATSRETRHSAQNENTSNRKNLYSEFTCRSRHQITCTDMSRRGPQTG